MIFSNYITNNLNFEIPIILLFELISHLEVIFYNLS